MNYIKEVTNLVDLAMEFKDKEDAKHMVLSGKLALLIRNYVNNLFNNSAPELVDFEIDKFLRDGCYEINTADLDTTVPYPATIQDTQRELQKAALRYVLNNEMSKYLKEKYETENNR